MNVKHTRKKHIKQQFSVEKKNEFYHVTTNLLHLDLFCWREWTALLQKTVMLYSSQPILMIVVESLNIAGQAHQVKTHVARNGTI